MSGGPDLPKCDMVSPPAEREGVRFRFLVACELTKPKRDGAILGPIT